MKKLIFLLVCFLCIQHNAKAQLALPTQTSTTPESYFRISDSIVNQYYGASDSFPENSPKATHQRFKTFYESRSKAQFTNGNISGAYHDAIQAARTRGIVCGDQNLYRGNWSNIGPRSDNKPYQNQGMVTCIWSDPLNPSIVLIGTEQGGLWKTTNANDGVNTNWFNLTDNSQPLNGTLGIQALAVNPNNSSDIYIATSMGVTNQYDDIQGLGIWHSTDAGVTWALESSGFTNASSVKATELKFCPYPVNGQAYIVAAIQMPQACGSHLWGNISGTWSDLTPNAILTNYGPYQGNEGPCNYYSDNFNDIEFMSNHQGKILIANSWANIYSHPAVYVVDFDASTGLPNNPIINPVVLVNNILNGNFIDISPTTNYPYIYDPSSPKNILSFSVEYLGNDKIYLMYNAYDWTNCNKGIPIPNGNGAIYPFTEVPFYSSITEFNFTSPNAITHLVTGLYADFQYNDIGFVASKTEDVMYVSLNDADIVYKTNGTWKWKTLGGYSSNHYGIHADVRSVYLGQDIPTSTTGKLGNNHIVYWGSDGGISKTSLHDITQIQSPNNNDNENGLSLRENLNGNNLYIADLYDVDTEPFNKAYTDAANHNGWHFYDNATDVWSGDVAGDGINSRFDKRLDGRMLYKSNANDLVPYDDVGNTLSTNSSVSINSPEPSGYQFLPMQFREDRFNLGIKRAWQSNSSTNTTNPYFNLSSTFNFDLDNAPNNVDASNNFSELKKNWLNGVCKQFMVTPSNAKKAYYLLSGAKGQAKLNRGVEGLDGSGNPLWYWVNNGGADITPDAVKDPTAGLPANDFCIDPYNDNRIFLGMGGVASADGVDRVLMSEDGGDTWVNMSSGLSALPVNCIVYQSGTDDIMYAGCDDGIYCWKKDLQCWVKMNCSVAGIPMPNILVTRLRINYCSGKLIAASWGRGIWESDLIDKSIPSDIISPLQALVSATNQVWTGVKHIESSIIVKAGTTLTIQGSLAVPTIINMPKYGQIIVEKGAKLIIDNATITNACDLMWHGIFVQGDYTKSQQSMANGYYLQGFCEIKNGSIIENSENGIANYYHGSGGIVLASNSTFRNNRRSVAFLKYQNFHPTNLSNLHDKSTFTNCVFDVDNTMSNQNVFSYHVTAWAVNGIKFYGCDFKNNQTNATPREKAIYSIDASYIIRARCLNNTYPCTSWDKNTFTNFDFGVEALGYSGESLLEIDQADFIKNQYGVSINQCNLPIITRNNFQVGPVLNPNYIVSTAQDFNSTNPTAIILNQNSNFKLEENHVSGLIPSAKTNKANGIWIQNMWNDNSAYKNNIHDVSFANVAFGQNMYKGMAGTLRGLKYFCNLQNSNDADMVVYGEDVNGNPTYGIHPIQGTNTNAAANTFSHSTIYPNSDISNSALNTIDYYHRSLASEVPLYYNSPAVILNSTNTTATCPSNFSDGKLTTIDASNHVATLAKYTTANGQFNTLSYLYANLIDGGNTNALVTNITESWSTEMMDLRNVLLSRSPNLSERALSDLANNVAVPQAMLMEILLLNPQGTKSFSFLRMLEFEISNPLNSSLIDLIKDSWSEDSYRKTLEANLFQASANRNQLLYDMIMSAKLDEECSNCNQIPTWLSECQSLNCMYDLADYYESAENYIEANNVLLNLSTQFELSDQEEIERQAAINLIAFKSSLQASNMPMNQLSVTKKNELQNFVVSNIHTEAGAKASNALCFFYNECTNSNSGGYLNSSAKSSSVKLQTKSSALVFPNPVDKFATIKFTMNNATKIIIHDALGRKVDDINITNKSGSQIVNTSMYVDGMYYFSIISSSHQKINGSFNVLHP